MATRSLRISCRSWARRPKVISTFAMYIPHLARGAGGRRGSDMEMCIVDSRSAGLGTIQRIVERAVQ